MHKPACQNWLLLRGLARESAHWGDFIPSLQTAFPTANIHTLDLPGTGEFFKIQSPKTITGILEFVHHQARQRGLLQQPLSLLALSLGGMVSWEWMLKHPDEIAGAVIVNTSLASLSPFYQRLRWQTYLQFAGLVLERDICRREQAIIKLICNQRQHNAKTTAEWIAIQNLRPVNSINSLRQIMAAATYRPAPVKPGQPILLINSRHDRLVSACCSAAIAEKHGLEMITHPWGGHDLALDDGSWLMEQLKAWSERENLFAQ